MGSFSGVSGGRASHTTRKSHHVLLLHHLVHLRVEFTFEDDVLVIVDVVGCSWAFLFVIVRVFVGIIDLFPVDSLR